ncbi:TIGR02757 family protein [Robiginitalea sp. SC105]|uniref:TIGR02757 family protein n=1 Tax=Robiginitalea sp. SC105 TaxID=2762332 RepID=UPI00163A8E38|nr:TIGR02757 family protein [Robiginitalea sp. SC105]MBC2840650.1 TIGR02757 family protein [Robiginitalea sp. SC105]
MTLNEKREFLDAKVRYYQRPEFLESDPIQIPHAFDRKEDIEISGFLAATIAWGNRKSIIRSGGLLMELMGNSPLDFVLQAKEADFRNLQGFVHRTFNAADLKTFILCLRHVYQNHGGLESLFTRYASLGMQPAIGKVREHFFEIPHAARTRKHFSDPGRGSAAKRLNMFLRWMVRPPEAGVDFGLWDSISPSLLSCPLDVHSGKVARALGLLKRKQNDAKAVAELDRSLRKLDPADPVKYDFALFGLGVFEGFPSTRKDPDR